MAEAQAEVAAPPVVGVVDDEDPAIDYAICRAELDAFFEKRVHGGPGQTTRWQLRDNLPRKGRDTEFDALLHRLGILNKRSYQSQHWLQFKKARGIIPPPQFKMENSEQLLAQIVQLIQPEDIVTHAADHTAARIEYKDELRYSVCQLIASRNEIRIYLVQEVGRLADSLCSCALKGATPRTISTRAANRIIDYRWTRRKEFIAFFVLQNFPQESRCDEIPVRIFFSDLHQELSDEWDILFIGDIM